MAKSKAAVSELAVTEAGPRRTISTHTSGRIRCRSSNNMELTVEMPAEEEMEEFFAAAEGEEKKRFMEKYNYDVVKDEPMGGRYQWVLLL